ncbi:MAG: hypothetical protein COW03_17650 [Cytophagales bacterium CG12_big_fil_rev_8_21_14_0_65_40_12]|nr:MAG: hypothetical protein COW03_17650 [Cytophagales bacterium CG12_big_fil_rev_8_21_14_0_65_40_12]PIW06153.1 MAG: hypothetical protein COW40_01065 [Cytophagales bacterium CG17_big_fil_post_rev_8_21_14_2_50_40_13]
MRLLSLVLISFFVSFHASGQENTWKTLAKISIEKRFDELLNYDIEYPIFSEAVKKLNGTKISVEGWMIPLDELRGENYFVLSSLPFANCFFCGGAGPETVMEVFSKDKIDYTEKRIIVTGTLTINTDDPLRLMYILNDAQIKD